MNDIEQKRLALFLFGCIGTRLLFVYVAKTQTAFLPYMAVIAALIAAGLIYFYLTGTRTTGPEVFGEKIWWNLLRPVHSFLYGFFAYLAITGNRNAWVLLLVDALVGLGGFIHHSK